MKIFNRFLCLFGGGILLVAHKIVFKLANLTDETKRIYLRKHGCKIGDKTRFVGNCSGIGSEPYLIEIGEDCLISDHVNFHTHDGGVSVLNSLGYFKRPHDKIARIKVGNNCFLGSRSTIMMGVTIGDNCIIGADSVVCKDIPANSVAAGMPAKIICTIDDYYKKNIDRGFFYESAFMPPKQKRKYLEENVIQLKE